MDVCLPLCNVRLDVYVVLEDFLVCVEGPQGTEKVILPSFPCRRSGLSLDPPTGVDWGGRGFEGYSLTRFQEMKL